MSDPFIRTEMLLGADAMHRLAGARVAVFGLGGVGGHAAEALCRAGIGALDLVDNDTVAESNLNRQIFATRDTLGMLKTDAAAQRLLSINPDLKLVRHAVFFLPDTADRFDFSQYDYVVDAIDTVAGKLEIITRAISANVPVISAMGTGNKLDPGQLRVTDIAKTSGCPLARVMRRELKKRGIAHLKVVCSDELPLTPAPDPEAEPGARRLSPGSVSFVPSVAGLMIAGVLVRELAGLK